MMNGKNISFIAGLFVIGLALGNKTTVDQYLNRLSEFFLDDISCAKNDFFELLDMGLNPSDCFEITIAKSSLV
jgi:hypothetical protein